MTPGIDDTPFIRFGLNQLTIDEEIAGRGRYSGVNGDQYVERVVPDQGLGYYQPGTLSGDRQPPPRRQSRVQDKRPDTRRSKAPIFIAADPPNSDRYPNLTYVPPLLRPVPLAFFMITCILIIAALIFCNVYSSRHNGLWDYDRVGGDRYFVFQYLPQMIGISILLWLFAVQNSVYRCLPFILLANKARADTVLQNVSNLPRSFLLPDLSLFRQGEVLFGVCHAVFWLTNFTIPLLASAFQTKVLMFQGQGTWRWTAVEGVIWILMVLYIMLAIALAILLTRLRQCKTGLLWDLVSLADVIPVFQKSNIISDFFRSDVSEFARVPSRPLRLGYWTLSNSNTPFYCVAEENRPQTRSSFEAGTTIEKLSPTSTFDPEAQRHSNSESYLRDLHSPYTRFRWAPWFLRDSAVLAWSVTAVVLLVAFIVVSFVNNAVRDGFDPRVSTAPNSAGFSPSNFLYSFLPGLLGMVLVLAWQPIDTYFRAVQPFADMTSPHGATAKNSLLLSYPSLPPIVITVTALRNRHFKVAFISFISLLSLILPTLAGGVFSALRFPSDNSIRIIAHMPGYTALVVFLCIYAFATLNIWPRRKRYLPHGIYTLAEQMSFLYQSPLLTEQGIRGVKTRAELVAGLVGRRGRDNGSEPRFYFNTYLGRDGREHLGIDRLARPGSGEVLIDNGEHRKN